MSSNDKWVKPELIVLVKGDNIEQVLSWCKSPSTGWWSNGGCVYHDHSDCFENSSTSDS